MLCWSCGKEIPDDANRCRYCEAEVESGPTEDEIGAVEDLLGQMSPDAISELRAAFGKSETGEEFVNRIMVGDCPKCGSSNTGDCGEDPEINDPSIGRCFDCGQLWCVDCGELLATDQAARHGCEGDQIRETDLRMSRYHLLAAEVFGYSFANYEDHLGIGHERFETLMPQDAETLEHAHREHWPAAKVAESLSVDVKTAERLLSAFQRAIQVIDAENPAESFRNAIRFVIQDAVAEGLTDEESIEALVTQICYRAADLAMLLAMEGQPLSRYSRHLRREADVDYGEGYFDE